jgi:tRNA-specific 2-thiouridylase
MRTWMNEELLPLPGECPWEDDVVNARSAAEKIGIPFRIIDLVRDYRQHVVEYLIEGYRKGMTPNPDIVCNREMKFGIFLQRALNDGFQGIATGHYARRRDNSDGSTDILEGLDAKKDQSYFLALLRQDQARLAHFPLGSLQKSQVREIARNADLPNAARKDSQGICFLGKVPINNFLALRIPDNPGPIVNASGTTLGFHRGLHRYTLGQRKGLDIPSNKDNEHYVVIAKEIETNTLRVAFDHPADAPTLYTNNAHVHSLSWLNVPVTNTCELDARVRYRDPATRIQFTPDKSGGAHVLFHETQRGIAPGQILAIYDGATLLGGGVFC